MFLLYIYIYIFLKIHVGLNGRNVLRVGSPRLLFYSKNSHNICSSPSYVFPGSSENKIYGNIQFHFMIVIFPTVAVIQC